MERSKTYPNETMVDYDRLNSRGYRVSKEKKRREMMDLNKDNKLTHFNFFTFLANYKREEV